MRHRIAFLAVAAAVGFAPAGRAGDQIDRLMVEQSADIAKAVHGMGGKNVAVLKFDYQTGTDTKTQTFSAGTVNITMARRLENLLTLENDPVKPTNVLADAGEYLAKIGKDSRQNITWRTDSGRAEIARKLKGQKLAVLWDGSLKYTPDVYVTGLIQATPGYTSAKVVFYGFTAANPKDLKTLYTLEEKATGKAAARGIRTDRGMLASFGQSFTLKPKAKSRSSAADDAEAIVDAGQRDQTDAPPVVSNAAASPAADQCPVKLEVFYDGLPQSMQQIDGESRMPSPNAGQKVHFQLTNASATETYAVLLAVNGMNTNALDQDTLTAKMPGDQRKWVLGPNETYKIEGFYQDGTGAFKPFEVLGEEESVKLFTSLSEDYAGKFSLYVFGNRPVDNAAAEPKNTTESVDAALDTAGIELALADASAADLSAAPRGVATARSLKAYQDALSQATHVQATARGLKVSDAQRRKYMPQKARGRGMINVGSATLPSGEIKQVAVSFEPLPMSHYTITYYKKPN